MCCGTNFDENFTIGFGDLTKPRLLLEIWKCYLTIYTGAQKGLGLSVLPSLTDEMIGVVGLVRLKLISMCVYVCVCLFQVCRI